MRDVTDEESTGIKKVKKTHTFSLFGSTETLALFCIAIICAVLACLYSCMSFPPVYFYYLQSAEHYAEVGRTHNEEFLPFGTTYQAAEAAKL